MIKSILTNDGLRNSILAQAERGMFIKVHSFGVSDVAGEFTASRDEASINTEWFNEAISYGKIINDNTFEVGLSIPPNSAPDNREIAEIYIYGEDSVGTTFLLGIAQPETPELYTPESSLVFRLQQTIQNINVDTVFQFVYTQATEISEHDEDPNAHEFIQTNQKKFGIFANEVESSYVGQNIDQYASSYLHAEVDPAESEILYFDDVTQSYRLAVADDSDAQNAFGLYIPSTGCTVSDGIVNLTHSYEAFTNLFLSKTVAGAISTEFSAIFIGHALADNKIKLDMKNIIKFGSVAGGGGGAGSFMPIMGEVSPFEEVVNGMDYLLFDQESSQEIFFNFKIPEGYVKGNQLMLMGGVFFCPDTDTGNVSFEAETALIKKGDAQFDTFTDIHNSTNDEVDVNTTQGKQTVIGNIDLTDLIGQINGLDVEAGDILRIKVYRNNASETISADSIAYMPRTCFEPKKSL